MQLNRAQAVPVLKTFNPVISSPVITTLPLSHLRVRKPLLSFNMQSCPDEILDMIAAVLYERWTAFCSFGQVGDLCNFALTSKRMARITQRHRFRSILVRSTRNDKEILRTIRRNPTLLTQTTRLLLDLPFSSSTPWITSHTASVVIDHLVSVRCLDLLNVSVNPDSFTELNGAACMFSNMRELRIALNTDLHETSDLFRLLRLFPRLEVLQLDIEGLRVDEWDKPSFSVKSDLQKAITTPMPRPLRELHLRPKSRNYPNEVIRSRPRECRGDPSPEQLRVLLDQLLDLKSMGALEAFGIYAQHQAYIIKFINQNSQTLKELHVDSPQPHQEDHWSQPPFKWKLARLPLLSLIQVHKIAYMSSLMVADLLELLISSCTKVEDLKICLSEHNMSWNAYIAGFSGYTYPDAATGAGRWEALDQLLSSSGCREVCFDMSVVLPDADEDISAPEILADHFPRCHAQGKLKINVSFWRPTYSKISDLELDELLLAMISRKSTLIDFGE
jgi:hypothetical protein